MIKMRSTTLLSLVLFILILSHENLDAKPDMTSFNSVHVGKKTKGEQENQNESEESGFEDQDYIYTQSIP
ncbi:hypothetical protein Hanom_Chr14g01284981 [Helianthus anomalus]